MTKYLIGDILLEKLASVGFVVRDHGLFLSCVYRPATTLYGVDAYPSLALKTAALLESFVKNHPMIDGNKRSGWLSANLFVEINGFEFTASHDEAFDFILSVATSASTLEQLATWIDKHLQPKVA